MINVKDILEKAGIPATEAAAVLFPKNKYPELALNRVLNGEAELSSTQVFRLAEMTHEPIASLYSEDYWKAKTVGERIQFERGDARVILDWESKTSRVFRGDEEIGIEIIHSPAITLREYLKKIDNEIDSNH